nr:reverse transcriptase domain-containing protein [Tanacetum cinerariifolium]
FLPLHDDPYMKVMQAYDATNELNIPPLQAPIASPTDMPLVLSLYDSQDFLPLEEISPPKDAKTSVESSISASPSSSVGSLLPVTPPPDYPFDKSIFAELDNSLWIIPRLLGSKPVPKEPNEMPPKRKSTSAAPAMTHAAIRQLIGDGLLLLGKHKLQPWLLTNKYCPRTKVKKMEDEFYNLVVKGNDLKTYIRRCQDLAVLYPKMVPNSEKLMEVFIGGLPRSIKGNVTASKPQTLEEAITIT